MNNFWIAIDYINTTIYHSIGMNINSIIEESQNHDYGAGKFDIDTGTNVRAVRFRVAKITPTKLGQFVSCWEKDIHNKNTAYTNQNAPDLLVITVFSIHGVFGQFVFPKNILLSKNILRTDTTQGKMAFRVYPSWVQVVSQSAVQTQRWQLDYFFEVNDISKLPTQRILALYNQ